MNLDYLIQGGIQKLFTKERWETLTPYLRTNKETGAYQIPLIAKEKDRSTFREASACFANAQLVYRPNIRILLAANYHGLPRVVTVSKADNK